MSTLHSLIWRACCNTPKSWQKCKTEHTDWQASTSKRKLIPLWLATILGRFVPSSHFWSSGRDTCLSDPAPLGRGSYLMFVVLRQQGIIMCCYFEHPFSPWLKAAVGTFLIKLARYWLKPVCPWTCSRFYLQRFHWLIVIKKSTQILLAAVSHDQHHSRLLKTVETT